MMIIRDCSRCGETFMYDPNHDFQLIKGDDEVICQECQEKEVKEKKKDE